MNSANSTSKITDKIARDAALYEETALRDAEAAAALIRDGYKSKAESAVAEIAGRCEKNAERTLQRAESGAERVKRNGVLAAKSAVLDETFRAAAERLINGSDAKYLDLMTAVAVKASENISAGETGIIIMNKEDAGRFGKTLAVRASKKSEARLVLSDGYADIMGGFILRCGNIDINCSIEAIVSSARTKAEAEVVDILFK